MTWQRVGGPAEDLWTPAELTTTELLGWWKPESLGTGGSSISSWTDSSGNSHPLVQATGSLQPTVVTTGPNGLKAASFDGTDDYLRASYTNTAPDAVFMLYRMRGHGNGRINMDGVANVRSFRENAVAGNISTIAVYGYEGLVYVERGASTDTYRLVCGLFGVSYTRARLDDNQSTTGHPGGPNNTGTQGNPGGITIAAGASLGNYSPLDVCEVIHLAGIPSPVTRQRITNYLGKKTALW